MEKKRVQVAVGVIVEAAENILITRRAENAHQGGLWEFPGGKMEAGESAEQALRRELEEEVGIEVQASEPLIQIPFHYPDKSVYLHVRKVTAFTGQPEPREGQPMCWATLTELIEQRYPLPAANQAILTALSLPKTLAISGDFSSREDFFQRLEKTLASAVSAVQVRITDPKLAFSILQEVGERFAGNNSLIANVGCVERHQWGGLDTYSGLHLSAKQLLSLSERPKLSQRWLGASCHNPQELQHAQKLNLDYVTLSPVKETQSHPNSESLGWPRFAEWVAEVPFPVYALGGVGTEDVATAVEFGAQGVAGIRSFWR